MEKKTIILNLSCELIDKIDKLNTTGNRSSFISDLLEEQLKSFATNDRRITTELMTKMSNSDSFFGYLLRWISGV